MCADIKEPQEEIRSGSVHRGERYDKWDTHSFCSWWLHARSVVRFASVWFRPGDVHRADRWNHPGKVKQRERERVQRIADLIIQYLAPCMCIGALTPPIA